MASRIAAHWEQAEERAHAAHYYDLAAEYALAVASPHQAVGFRRQALALDPTASRHFKLGETLFRLGELTDARSEFETAQRAIIPEPATTATTGRSVGIAVSNSVSFGIHQSNDQLLLVTFP